MIVVPNERTRELLELEMALGGHATPDEALNAILQEHLASGIDLEGLKDSLRVSMQQPRISYQKGMFTQLAEKIIARERGK